MNIILVVLALLIIARALSRPAEGGEPSAGAPRGPQEPRIPEQPPWDMPITLPPVRPIPPAPPIEGPKDGDLLYIPEPWLRLPFVPLPGPVDGDGKRGTGDKGGGGDQVGIPTPPADKGSGGGPSI